MSDTIKIDELKNENKKLLYKHLWENKHFGFNVIRTGKTDPSYEFEFAGKSFVDFIGEAIADNFDIKDKEFFLEKFNMSCSGTGDEIKKITTLHSSSLCALLFFFNVREYNKLIFEELKGYEFTQSFFEFKNKVIGYPSNIDVVLLGKNIKTKKKVILFLESKFSEYITGINNPGTQYEIGKSYFKEGCFSAPIYNSLSGNVTLKNVDGKYYISADTSKYLEGLKQMVSHYFGIRNFMNKEYYEKDNEILPLVLDYKAEEFLLGEILFDNFGKDLRDKYLLPYEEDYTNLAKIINAQCEKERITNFHVIENSLHYSSLALKDFISDFPKIKDFYFGE